MVVGLGEVAVWLDDLMLYDFHQTQYLPKTQNLFETFRKAALFRYFPTYIHSDSVAVIFDNPNTDLRLSMTPEKFAFANRGGVFFLWTS
jgi:hypothetical protein